MEVNLNTESNLYVTFQKKIIEGIKDSYAFMIACSTKCQSESLLILDSAHTKLFGTFFCICSVFHWSSTN